jgi:glycosyltransferase involved in cell wall biosynthesis
MPEWPFASIVVPVFNGGDTIDDLLRSLLALNYPQELCEIIVVDNDSNDDTPQRVQQYPVTLLYESEIHSYFAARNRGIRAARGDIIVSTDPSPAVQGRTAAQSFW